MAVVTRERPVRAVVIDDTSDIRELLSTVLTRSGMDVVGEAGDGRAGVDVVRAQRPDVVLLDLAMPVMDGVEALPIIRALVPDARIIVLVGLLRGGARPGARLGRRRLPGQGHAAEERSLSTSRPASEPLTSTGDNGAVTDSSTLEPAVAGRLKRAADGLVPAVVQQHGTCEVLMLGWMDDVALPRTLTTGGRRTGAAPARSTGSRGRPPATGSGSRGPAGLRRRRAAGHRGPGGAGLPHRRRGPASTPTCCSERQPRMVAEPAQGRRTFGPRWSWGWPGRVWPRWPAPRPGWPGSRAAASASARRDPDAPGSRRWRWRSSPPGVSCW